MEKKEFVKEFERVKKKNNGVAFVYGEGGFLAADKYDFLNKGFIAFYLKGKDVGVVRFTTVNEVD